MVDLIVVSVSRKSSAEVRTAKITYEKGVQNPVKKSGGAEWEEIEMTVKEEDKPTIMVGNVMGSAFIANRVLKLIINSPDLFGKFKVGDIVPLTPETKDEKEVKS